MTELADAVAAAVCRVPGVAALHPGLFGEVGTYLPGRRVPGVRLGSGVTEVHIALAYGSSAPGTAAAVRTAVAELVGGAVDVTVADVVAPGEPGDLPAGPPETVATPVQH